MKMEVLEKKLASRLKSGRYLHCIGVRDCAVRLAERFSVDPHKAALAGLLHDCAREVPVENMLAAAREMRIAIDPVEEQVPLLLHAVIGARMLPSVYGIDDAEVQQAVSRHTVGGRNMTPLDKIIYLADMIEPNRMYPGVEELRQMAFSAKLDEVMLTAFDQSILFILKKHTLLHPDTIAARNEILCKE